MKKKGAWYPRVWGTAREGASLVSFGAKKVIELNGHFL